MGLSLLASVRLVDIARGGFVLHPAWLQAAFIDVGCRFFDLSRCKGPQIIVRFKPFCPGKEVHLVQLFSAWLSEIEVERLAHIDPFLSAACAFDDPLRVDFEGGEEDTA